MAVVPTQVNEFSQKLEKAPDLHIAPSPAEQRRLSMYIDRPLIETAQEYVEGKITATGDAGPNAPVDEQSAPSEPIDRTPEGEINGETVPTAGDDGTSPVPTEQA